MEKPNEPVRLHVFDQEAVCVKCGFDGAEWHSWKTLTEEGRASVERQPPCRIGE